MLNCVPAGLNSRQSERHRARVGQGAAQDVAASVAVSL